jgi:hypothetical protein
VVILKPIISKLVDRATAITATSIDWGTSAGTPSVELKREEIQRLAEEPKEQLEKLRLFLETEQIKQLIGYHQNGVYQSKISFWFSIGAACFGFLIIIMGVLSLFLGNQALTTSYVSIGSGAIVDAVAALFFTQSNQARRLMTEFFDKLRLDRQFNEALRLCNSIQDADMQSTLQVRLSLFFAGIRESTGPINSASSPVGKAGSFSRRTEASKDGVQQASIVACSSG